MTRIWSTKVGINSAFLPVEPAKVLKPKGFGNFYTGLTKPSMRPSTEFPFLTVPREIWINLVSLVFLFTFNFLYNVSSIKSRSQR